MSLHSHTEAVIEQISTKVQQGKRAPRVWMEGRPLERAGFTPGTTYVRHIDEDTNTIELRVDPNGTHTVSIRKSTQLPLIEITNKSIEPITEGHETLVCTYYEDRIVIEADAAYRKQREREARFLEEIAQGRITEGTLCAGIGMSTFGLHEGFKEKGITSEVRWVVDREAKYLDAGYKNNPSIDNQTQLFTMSLEQLEPSLLLPVSVISVSLGCTGHSKSGKVKNRITNAEEHATDATAVFGLMRAVEQVNPSIIVSENVVEARDSATYVLIKSYLSLLGYNVYEVELDNRQSGAFQRRLRYWFVAVSKGLPSINLATIPAFEAQYAKLGELMDPVSADDPCWAENTYLKEKALRDEAAGKGFSRHLVNEDSEYVTVINRHYGKKQSTPSMIQREDGMERLLTPAEVARSMNCPEELVAGTTKTTAYEGLGQGVDINHARGIAHTLVRDLMGIEHGTAASNVIDPVEFAANDEPDLASPQATTAPGQQLGMF